jgi:hypothetical protein
MAEKIEIPTSKTQLFLMFRLFLFLPFVISCQHFQREKPVSFRDSVLQYHVRVVDSAGLFDQQGQTYDLLKAYNNNDTAWLRQYYNDINKAISNGNEWYNSLDSCIHQKRIDSLGAEEVYRFKYWMAFCAYDVDITISRKGDSCLLHFLMFTNDWSDSTCSVVSEYSKPVTRATWDKIVEGLEHAEFWRLDPPNKRIGFDGSTLNITGYRRNLSAPELVYEKHGISRWAPEDLAIWKPFRELMKISGDKRYCWNVEKQNE